MRRKFPLASKRPIRHPPYMVLNFIWVAFFLIAFVTGLVKLLFFGDMDVFPAMVQSMFDMAEVSVSIAIGYIGLMALWLGIMKIGEQGGAVGALSYLVQPFFSKLFPGIPKGHPAHGSIMMNFSANMLGLDNAATPLGLKAMGHLQELNKTPDRASDAQIMFLVLNTSGLTVIPISVITLRAANGAANPVDVFMPILIATYFATLGGLIAVSIVQKIKLWHPTVLAYLGGATALICALLYYFANVAPVAKATDDLKIQASEIFDPKAFVAKLEAAPKKATALFGVIDNAVLDNVKNDETNAAKTLVARLNEPFEKNDADQLSLRLGVEEAFPSTVSKISSRLMSEKSSLLAALVIFSLVGGFLILALIRRVNVYESFIEGAKDGFQTAVRIIPYLVAMLVAIGVFRASGAMDYVIGAIASLVGMMGFDTGFVDALPTAVMKPLSGSGARGMAVETMQNFGADSFVGKLACTFQGSTETTFYTLAVYFGAVGVSRTRYTIFCGLFADFVGITAAIFVAYFFFH